jgi:hypothetical protein
MKKVVLIVVPILAIGGGVVGAGFMGLINIPGITPKKPVKKAMYGEQKEPPEAARSAPTPPSTPPLAPVRPARAAESPAPDLEKGAKRVARLWNELPAEQLVAIAAPWRDDELALVLMSMDGEKAAAVLGRLDAPRASRLSRAIQRLAAMPAKQ